MVVIVKKKKSNNFFRMVGEKSIAHVARSDGWEGIGTKRHQNEKHPVCTRCKLNGGPYATGAYRIGGPVLAPTNVTTGEQR